LNDYRRIPNLTVDELEAIEELKGRIITFGTIHSGKAFEGKDGQKGGYLINLASFLWYLRF
jgi:hypothetical protein